jgi:two-component system phosphate regulon response regulator PhoB
MKRTANGAKSVRRKPRILVIEDDLQTRQALEALLAIEGQEVRGAQDGEQALLMLDRFAADVVVMDWRLPGLGGAQLCRRIRRRRGAPAVIILSSADEAFVTKTDAADRLRKPVDLRQLNAAIAEQLHIAALGRRGR